MKGDTGYNKGGNTGYRGSDAIAKVRGTGNTGAKGGNKGGKQRMQVGGYRGTGG